MKIVRFLQKTILGNDEIEKILKSQPAVLIARR